MSTPVQELLYNASGQSIYFDAPEGRASSITDVQVWEDCQSDEAGEEGATTGSASADSVNTTFSATSGAGEDDPTKCNLASLSSVVVGRRYLATNAAGETEWIEVQRKDTAGVDVYSRLPLVSTFDQSDTFVGTRLTISIDATWLADRNNLSDPLWHFTRYRAVWTYVVSSVTYRASSFFDVVRYPITYDVTPLDVDRRLPGWLDRVSADYRRGQGASLIAEAQHQVRIDLWKETRGRWQQRNTDVVRELVILKANQLEREAALHSGGVSSGNVLAADAATKLYWNAYQTLMREPKIPQVATADGAAAMARRLPLWRR